MNNPEQLSRFEKNKASYIENNEDKWITNIYCQIKAYKESNIIIYTVAI